MNDFNKEVTCCTNVLYTVADETHKSSQVTCRPRAQICCSNRASLCIKSQIAIFHCGISNI